MSDLEMAKSYIEEGKFSCVIVKDSELIYTSTARGIFPLYEAKEILNLDLNQSSLADKVIGKGAAMIAHEAGIENIYGQLMSEQAVEYLEKFSLTIQYKKLTPYIKNRDFTGMCPIETRAIASSDYQDFNIKVEEFLKSVNMI